MPVAQSADGVLHEFPDGTPQSVMDGAMLSYARSNLGATEPENGVIGNLARGIGERASKVVGGLGRALFTAVDPIAQPIERGLEKIGIPTSIEIGPSGASLRHSTEADYAAPGGTLTQDMISAAENAKLGYKPGTTWEDVKKSPLSSVIPFALEQGIVSAPDMAAAIAALPAYVVARTGEIGQTRAKNDERSNANLGDLVAALPAAVGSALLERIGTKGILGLDEVAAQGFKGVIKETGKAGLKEGATETGQEFVENLGEELGTKKGVDVASMGDRMLAAAVGGAGFGAPVRAVGATAQALRGDQSSVPPPPPTLGAPAAAAPPPPPGAPPLRTVTIGTIPPQETWEVDKDGNQIEPPPTPTRIDILSEPDEDDLQTIRYPDGSVVQAPASGIKSRLIPEAEAPIALPEAELPVVPTEAELPAAPPEDEPTISGGPGITDFTDVTEPAPPPAVEPQIPPPTKIKKVFTSDFADDDEVATTPPPLLEPEPAAVVERLPLPADLSKAAPRLGQFQLNFENDLDKAIYIANSKSSSRAKDRFVNWLKDDQGFSDPEIKSLGAQIKAGILDISRSGANPAEPMRLPAYAAPKPAPVGKIPDVGVAAPAPLPPLSMASPAPVPTMARPKPAVKRPPLMAAPPLAPVDMESTVEVLPTEPAPAVAATPSPTLPPELAVAKPRHVGHPVDWTGSDVERAAYIATSDVTPAAKAPFVDWLSQNNIPDDQVESIGTQVRSNLDQASAAAPKPTAPLKAPAVFGVAAPAAPQVGDFMAGDQVRMGNNPGVVVGVDGDYIRFRPNTATSPKAYVRVPKRNIQLVSRPNTTSKASLSAAPGADDKFGTEQGKLDADLANIVQLLGANMYAENLGEVTVKELLQNAFDAVKGAVSGKKNKSLYKSGKIKVTLDRPNRTITITDNGRGMTADIVRNAFFTIAGSDKSDLDPSERSGGFGFAKMGFMMGAERLVLDTVRDGVRVRVDTTAKDISNSQFKIEKTKASDLEHGTTVSVKIPEEYIDPKNGNKKPIWFPYTSDSIVALNRPLIGPVEVDVSFNDGYETVEKTLPVGVKFPEKDYNKFQIKFSWGNADLYVSKERKDNPNQIILSSGIYQFNEKFKLSLQETVPYDIIVNVKPDVEAKDTEYPFENSRERFKGSHKEDVNALKAYVAQIARGHAAADLKENFKNIVSMPRVEADADMKGLEGKLKKSFDKTEKTSGSGYLPEISNEVIVTDGKVLDKVGYVVALSPKAQEQKEAEKILKSSFEADDAAPSSKDFMIKIDQNPKLPIFHNNTNVDFIKIGEEYVNPGLFFAELGTIMVEMKEALAKSGLHAYDMLSPENLFFGGIAVDKKYGGIHIRVPYKAVFLNPFYYWGAKTLSGVRENFLETMTHELAHTGDMNHGVGHNSQMIQVRQYLADEGLIDYFRDALMDVLVRHESTFTAMRDAYGKSDTKNIAKSLEDYQKSSASREAGGAGDGSQDELRPVSAGEGPGGDGNIRSAAASSAASQRGGGTGSSGQQNNALNAQSIAAHVAIMKPMFDFLDKKFGTRFAEAKPFDKQGLAALNSTLPPDQQLSRMPESRNVSDALSDFVARTSGNLQVFIKRHIDPVKKAIIEASKSGVDPQEIGMYLWARSAPARNLIVAKNNPEFKGAGSGLTNAEAQAIIDDFMRQGKLPTLMRVAKVHDALVDLMLKMRVDNGLMTAADAAALRKEQPFYAPLKGLAFKGDMQIAGDEDPHLGFEELRRSRKGISPREFIRARGRKTAPLNPLLNLTTDAQNLVLRIEKNRAMLPLLNNLLADPIGNADIAKVYTDKKPKRVPGEIDKKTGKRKFKTVNMRGDPSFTVIKKDGLNHYIEFNKDTDAGAAMSRAFANMSPATLNKFFKGYRALAAGIKSLMTRFSPDHIFRVAGMRDFMDSIVTAYASETMPGGAAEGKKVAANTVKYAFSPSTWGAAWRFAGGKDAPAGSQQAQILDLFETMVQDGGSDGRALYQDAVAQAKDIQKITSRLRGEVKGNPVITTKAGLQIVGDFMTRVMDFNNTVFRFATYRAALKAKIDPVDAARLARQATVDLTQKGEWTGILDNLYFFANPAVQSTIKQGQLLKSRNGRQAMYAFVTFGALTAMWNAMMGGGDDDDDGISNYDELNDLEKMTNLVIYFGPKKDDYVKVPFGFLVAFPAFTGQKLAEVTMGTTKPESAAVSLMEGAFQIGKAALQTFSPVKVSASEAADVPTSFIPSIAQPLVGLWRNKDYWGKNIYNVPSQYDEKAKSSMGRETTGAGYKWFAKFMNDMSGGAGNVNGWFDFQPEGYRYWINTLGGGPVRTLRNVANLANKDDADVRDIPVIKGWLGSGGEYDAQNSYYENTSKLAAISKAEEDDSEEDWAVKERKFPVQTDANIIDAYKETQKYLRQYYKDLDDALDGVTDAAERRKILDEMKSEKDEIYSEFNRTYNDTKRDMVGSRREVKAK